MTEVPAPELQLTAGATVAPSEPTAPKRNRRPSVRLGEIGDPPRRITYTKPWRVPSGKHSKTRPLTNVISFGRTLDGGDDDDVGTSKLKDFKKKGSKKPRTNLVGSSQIEGEDVDAGNRDFNAESPVFHSVSDEEEDDDNDDDNRESLQHFNGGGRVKHGEDWIRIWLNGIGLGRYAPVFEIHEVDDEVLHMLTLEDLKDMGINAVGSRRKLYCAIQKLGKGFS